MKVAYKSSRLAAVVGLAVLVAGCPLPFDYNGKGAGESILWDPSSPNITAPVTMSYAEEGGSSGTIPNGGAFYSALTTTVTLSTATDNAVIYYTDDGSPLINLSSAKKIAGSSGQITLARTTTVVSRDIRAVAVGPAMVPSPVVHATVGVSPYPILSVTRNNASITEDGGTATFTVTSSSSSTSDITVSLLTGGDYEASDVAGLAGGPGTAFTAILVASTTSIAIPITGQPDDDGDNDTVTLTIAPGSGSDYTVGAPASATVVVADNRTPVLTITRDAATISDNGGVVQFTVTSTFAPTSDLTVNLSTSGSYEAADVTGIPGPGGSFGLTVAAGATSTSRTVTAQTDPGEYANETVTIALVPNIAYTVGSPGSASVTITDSSPVGTLTLTADRATMVDGQSATFTVSTSAAPDANLVVNLSSSGYDAGKVTVPATVTVLSGATSATFLVTAPAEVGYEVQHPQVSIASGTGYTIGSPASQGVVISDNLLGVFEYAGVWSFNTGTGSNVGTGTAWTITGSVPLVEGALSFSGNYATDYATADISNASADIDKNLFTLAVRFSMSDLSVSRPIIAAGYSYRWLIAQSDTAGNLAVDLNNHTVQLDLGALAIATSTYYTLVLNVDAAALTLTAWLNGVSVNVALPGGFAWNTPTGDELLTSNDFSMGRAFAGLWDWVFVANGLLSYTEVTNLIATDPDL